MSAPGLYCLGRVMFAFERDVVAVFDIGVEGDGGSLRRRQVSVAYEALNETEKRRDKGTRVSFSPSILSAFPTLTTHLPTSANPTRSPTGVRDAPPNRPKLSKPQRGDASGGGTGPRPIYHCRPFDL